MIRTQLARVIASPLFCNAPRLSRFLSYVVDEALAGRSDRLKSNAIGLEVFDKPADFDPQTDTIVRVQARALRQKLDQYYAQDGAQAPVAISMARGSYVPQFTVPIHAPQIAAPAHRDVSRKPSIAVLPFDDYSETAGRAAFSDGLTEEVIANLSRFRELSVFSRSTTHKAKLDNLSIAQIHAAFAPDFVLEGSCRISEAAILITINLVAAAQDEVIVTQHFDHALTPTAFYAVQDEMAELIAERIADCFGPLDQYARRAARAGRSLKWDTFRWLSEYHRYTIQLCDKDRQAIKEGLGRALHSDPASSDAHAMLALILLDEYRICGGGASGAGLLDQALAKARDAVRWDRQNAVACEALALARFYRREFVQFEQAATRALALNPGRADMLAMIGMCYGLRMDWVKAMPLLDRAIALNPLQPGWFHIPKAIGLMMAGQTHAAIAQMRISPLPGVFFYHCHLAWFLSETNDIAGALEQKVLLLEVFPDFERVALAQCHAWCIDEAIMARAVAGWARLDLNLSG
jgi:TolB-like protein